MSPLARHQRPYFLAADGVTLHTPGIRTGLQLPVRLATCRADPPERPRRRNLDLVPSLPQAGDRRLSRTILDGDMPLPCLARIERTRECLGVVARCIDRFLEVHPEMHMREERVERPLILLVAARRAEREVGLAIPCHHRRRECRPRPLARLERVRQSLLEP